MAALRRGAGVTESSIKKIRLGLEKRWFAAIMLHGFDSHGKCWAELVLDIDWERHKIHITAGHEFAEVPEFWVDGVSPEVDEMVAEFIQFCDSRGLDREWRVIYSSFEDRRVIERTLGFSTAAPIEWAGKPASLGLGLRELDELKTTLRLVE